MASKTGNVSVTASDVEDNRITIGDITVSGSYSFGPSADEGGGLISASGDSEESLSASFSFTVSSGVVFSSLSASYDITLSLESDKTYNETDALAYATGTTVTGTNTNVTGTYLAAPATGLIGTTGITIATVSSSGVTANSSYSSGNLQVSVTDGGTDSKSATVTVTAAFGWGTYFNSENPVNLNNAEYLDDYVDGLTWLNTNLNEASFTYTVGGTASA